MRRFLFAAFAAVTLTVGMTSAAFADDDGSDDPKPAHAGAKDKADPANKTLPSQASATAKANAFGQQGDRERAAHAAAKTAALHAANDASDGHAADGSAASHGKSHGQGPASQAARGQATAAAARAAHAPATHPGR